MTPEQKIDALQLEQTYRRELIHACNTFPQHSSIQQIVDNAVFLQAAVHALQTDEPMATEISRYATVTEYQGYGGDDHASEDQRTERG